MSIENTPFKTRARTIDHLGREQIADCPTAISELWKNSYDAYARNVELNIFDGKLPVAALVDDGHGMNKTELVEKWLVVGTESKATGGEPPEGDRGGLPIRVKQGQKGIGRLSCASMGSLLLLLTKRKNQPYVAALIDWRIFENPFLLLNDVQIPVVEFSEKNDLSMHLPVMFDSMMSNLWGTGGTLDVERDKRIQMAWRTYDEFEQREQGSVKTRCEIEERIIESCFEQRHLNSWSAWNGATDQGTALFVTGISDDLQAHLSLDSLSNAASLESATRSKFFETLSGFIDPYYREDEKTPGTDFSCAVVVWNGDLQRILIDKAGRFSVADLDRMEHFVEGEIDVTGFFKGRLRVLGRDFSDISIAPSEPIKGNASSKVGPFSIRLGTFEILPGNTTHTEEQHSYFKEQTELYAAFTIHRDGFRLMPYGRVDNDFFQIETRRSKNAGDAFWVARRMFGGVKISRSANPNLRDKAGREGLIDNQAAKQFRELVINLLETLGKKYFGRHSDNRKQLLPDIQASKEKITAERDRKKIIARQRKEVRTKLKENTEPVNQILEVAKQLEVELVDGEQLSTLESILNFQKKISKLSADSKELGLGSRPISLGSLESEYTDYRRKEKYIAAAISNATHSISIALERFNPSAPQEIVSKEIFSKASSLSNRIRRWGVLAENELKEEQARLKELVASRHQSFNKANADLVGEVEAKNIDLSTALKMLTVSYESLSHENEAIFPPYIEALKSLREQIDLEGLVTYSVKETADLRDEIARIHALAQLGITVEIIGHEIEDLDLSIERGLDAMAPEAKNSEAYRRVQTAHHALSDRWRFLSPLKLSGEKIRKIITGDEIASYTQEFFRDFLQRSDIQLKVSEAFRQIQFSEMPSRIFPIFVNLLNNARYWVRHSVENKKTILFDFHDGKIIVADNGPGVADEDILSLFTLFFTKKASGGRGVGLYLCRTNLAAGGHKIWYETEAKNKILPGANFVIEINGLNNAK
jgi:signal transduction histidine kinase